VATRWYAVNDRPVRLVETADGGLLCEVLDLSSGCFVEDPSYLVHVGPGRDPFKDVDAFPDSAAFDRLVARLRAELVGRLAERLCWLVGERPEEVRAALAISLEPPPLAASEARLTRRPALILDRPELPLAALEPVLGPSTRPLARRDDLESALTGQTTYRWFLVIAGARHQAEVVADAPDPAAPVRLTIQRWEPEPTQSRRRRGWLRRRPGQDHT
jgi:hypothetical protein